MLATGLTAGTASATPALPVGGCGQTFELMTIQEIIDTIADPRFIDQFAGEDRNGDNTLCVKILRENAGPPSIDIAFVYTDNAAQGRA
jgi:hypothetical protein